MPGYLLRLEHRKRAIKMKVTEPKSYAFRRNETVWDREHVPLDRKIGREAYKARTKNAAKDNFRSQAEKNAGDAQVNAPANYMFQKKEW